MISKIYNFLSSAKLAIALLVIILACCVAGVTIWRGVEAGRVIFGTLWFNGLLVLLVVLWWHKGERPKLASSQVTLEEAAPARA